MASVSKQMNDMLGEIRGVRQLLDDEIKRSRVDHDEQIGIKKDLEAMQTNMVATEKRLKEKMIELEECVKEAKKKKWEVVLTIVSAFVTAIAAIIVYKAFAAAGVVTPDPNPSPRPHSAIYSPAEPRPFLLLRGEDRGTQNPIC